MTDAEIVACLETDADAGYRYAVWALDAIRSGDSARVVWWLYADSIADGTTTRSSREV